MAQKKLASLGVLGKTEPTTAPTIEKAESWGVSLQNNEWDEIEKIAAELNMKRGTLAAAFIRYALKEYKAGKMKTKTAKTLDI